MRTSQEILPLLLYYISYRNKGGHHQSWEEYLFRHTDPCNDNSQHFPKNRPALVPVVEALVPVVEVRICPFHNRLEWHYSHRHILR